MGSKLEMEIDELQELGDIVAAFDKLNNDQRLRIFYYLFSRYDAGKNAAEAYRSSP